MHHKQGRVDASGRRLRTLGSSKSPRKPLSAWESRTRPRAQPDFTARIIPLVEVDFAACAAGQILDSVASQRSPLPSTGPPRRDRRVTPGTAGSLARARGGRESRSARGCGDETRREERSGKRRAPSPTARAYSGRRRSSCCTGSSRTRKSFNWAMTDLYRRGLYRTEGPSAPSKGKRT